MNLHTLLDDEQKAFEKEYIKGHPPIPNSHHDVQEAESWVEAEPEDIIAWLALHDQKIITAVIEMCEGKIREHIIDQELYHDSGGGEMCEVCGKQGEELDEKCDRNNEYNEALADIKSDLPQALKKEMI